MPFVVMAAAVDAAAAPDAGNRQDISDDRDGNGNGDIGDDNKNSRDSGSGGDNDDTGGVGDGSGSCQKPFNLEGVDFNVDSLDVINLRSVKVSFYSKI